MTRFSIFKPVEGWFDLCKGDVTTLADKRLNYSRSRARIGAVMKNPCAADLWKAFFSQKELDDYLRMLQQAEKRDIARLHALDLFSIYHETAGRVWCFIIARWMLPQTIEDYVATAYREDMTGDERIFKRQLWNKVGHAII